MGTAIAPVETHMKRRTLLLGAASAAAGSFLSACRPRTGADWRTKILAGSVPDQVLRKFSQAHRESQLAFSSEPQILDLFEQLQNWQQPPQPQTSPWQRLLPWRQAAGIPTPAALVTLGDYWLQSAIEQALIQPLALADSTSWQRLPPRWQQLVKRNSQGLLAETGAIWGAPYRIQSLAIAYRPGPFLAPNWQPMHWSDLWLPELSRRIALPDHPRVAIGLAQTILGHSINDSDSLARPEVREQFKALHRQVKVYDSQTYLKALLNDDIWLAVGWSGDILAATARYPSIRALIPPEGTLLAADIWVQPKQQADTEAEKLSRDWIEFCWQRPVATQLSLSSHGISPVFVEAADADVPPLLPDLLVNQPMLLNPDIAQRSELIQPLPAAAQAAYWQLWQQTRQA